MLPSPRNYKADPFWREYHKVLLAELESYIDPKTGLLRKEFGIPRSCPVCGESKSKTLFVKQGFTFVRCECGMVYVNPMLDYSKVASPSSVFYADQTRRTIPRGTIQRVDTIRKLCGVGRLLEVGCGEGLFLEAAKNQGFDVWGIEINKGQVDRARQVLGDNIMVSEAETMSFAPDFFHVITMYQVIEHLSDPAQVLKKIHSYLQPNGYLVLETPNVEGFIIKLLGKSHSHFIGSGHRNFYSPKTMKAALSVAGFKIVSLETYGEEITPALFLQLIINPAVFDFSRKDYYKKYGCFGERFFNKRKVLGAVRLFDPPLIAATNAVKLGSYTRVIAQKTQS